MDIKEIDKIFSEIKDKLIKDIAENSDTLTPAEIDRYKLVLIGWYYEASARIGTLDQHYAKWWLELRQKSKTDKEAKMKYDCSEQGTERIGLKSRVKGVEKMIAGLKERQYRLDQEARAQY